MTIIDVRGASIVFCACLALAGAFQWKATTHDQQNEMAKVIVTSDGLVQDDATVNLQQAADDGTGKKVGMVIIPSGGLLQEGSTIMTHGDAYVQQVDVPPAVRNAAHQMIEAIEGMSSTQVHAVEDMMHPAPNATFLSNETEHEAIQYDANARKMLEQILHGQLNAAEKTAIELEQETKTLKAHDQNFDPDTNSTKLAELALGSAPAAAKSITNSSCSVSDAPDMGWGECMPCECLDRHHWCLRNCGESNCQKNSHWCWSVAKEEGWKAMLQGRGQGALLDKHVALGVVDEQGEDLGKMRNDDFMRRPGVKREPGQALKSLNDSLLPRKPVSRAGLLRSSSAPPKR